MYTYTPYQVILCICSLSTEFLPLQRGDAVAKLAVADAASGAIHILHARSDQGQQIQATCSLHTVPVTSMVYVPALDAVISADEKGAV